MHPELQPGPFKFLQVTKKSSSVHAKDPEEALCGVDDVTKLAFLHEPGVLQNLKSRYQMNEFYTYTGNNILIAVNPFQSLPHLYTDEMMKQYKGAGFGELLSPHPFAIANAAYRSLFPNNDVEKQSQPQSVIISGQSGAGKTETTKRIMHYLAYMGSRNAASQGPLVDEQVLQSYPILEAFGNAKTVRNNNSSRFSKFVEMQFDHKGIMSGAAIKTYLLEISRVCQISDRERNYHCFYMLCAAPPEVREKYKVEDGPRKFHYLNQSTCVKIECRNEAEEYIRTRKALDIIGISYKEKEAIFRVVAAILHLGNVEFAEGDAEGSSKLKDKNSEFHLSTAAELFECDEKILNDLLCQHIMVVRDENIVTCCNPEVAKRKKDTLAKTVYSRLFDWLVDKINKSIGSKGQNSKSTIGVLDTYEFENLKTNRTKRKHPDDAFRKENDALCRRRWPAETQAEFPLEDLQGEVEVPSTTLPRKAVEPMGVTVIGSSRTGQGHVFKKTTEDEEYKKEGIEFSHMHNDHQDVIELMGNKPAGGIIALLDETCLTGWTHERFAEKLYQAFKNNKHFSMPKFDKSEFTICHYAEEVIYQTKLFLDKNIDFDIHEYQALSSASKCEFVSGLFPPPCSSSKSSKFSFVGSRVKEQLQSLMETLRATEPHYICCIKPNDLLESGIFEDMKVLQQLRCAGVMEATRIISSARYPTRRTFDELIDRFGFLAPDVLGGSSNKRDAITRLLEKVGLQDYQIGKTKVFLRAGQMAELDARRNKVLHSASLIQRNVRSFSARKELNFRRQTRAAIIIQCAWRGKVARKVHRKLKIAAQETRALQDVKKALEKQVDELSWWLQLEKRMRVDLEEAKSQENAKLRAALQEVQQLYKETNEMLVQEREAAKKTEGIYLVNTGLMNKFRDENDKLKIFVSSLERKIVDTEKKYKETSKTNEEKLMDADKRNDDLNMEMLRLQKKILTMGSEEKMRLKGLLSTLVESIRQHFLIPIAPKWLEENRTPSMDVQNEAHREIFSQ
ncbi:hypothetical protein U9M48_040050 [Paspalum notatum var. saurae]|uniref:Myosin motor domain-containing protein n=1 Tax=Paspalum notatum var. saurae TaxID=547442 RepID=A0AAQ3ULX9_PASNO